MTGFRRALSLFNFYCRIMKEQCSFIFPSHVFRNAVSFPKTIAGILSSEDLVELVARCRALLVCVLYRLLPLLLCNGDMGLLGECNSEGGKDNAAVLPSSWS